MIDPVTLDEVVNRWICQRAAATATGSCTGDGAGDGYAGDSVVQRLQAVAVDGKEVRGAKHGGGSKTFLMATFDHRTGTVVGQEAVEAKTNEIPHLPVLLDRLGPLQGRVITADALHTLPQQAQAITDRGGHYLFTVKTNAKALHQNASSIGWAARTPQHRAQEKAHGRTSTWETTVACAPARLGFPKAAQIMRVQRGRLDHANPEQATGEIVYAVTSLKAQQASPAQLAGLLRGHWGIENRLHWVCDTAYDEDTSQIRAGKSAHVMATIRNLAISVYRLAGHTNIIATLRHYGRDPQLAADLTGL